MPSRHYLTTLGAVVREKKLVCELHTVSNPLQLEYCGPGLCLKSRVRWSRLNSSVIGSLRIISQFLFFFLSSRSLALHFPRVFALSVTSVREKCERLNVVHFVRWYVFGEPPKSRLFCFFQDEMCMCVCVIERETKRKS